MRLILLPLLFLVAGCAQAHPRDFERHTLRLEFERGLCSGTAVGRNVILSASHCWAGGNRLLKINGQEAYALKIAHDGKDHALVRVTQQFKGWATIGKPVQTGDRGRFVGNPAGEESVYRECYVARARPDETYWDCQGFGGDSGSGIHDARGRLIGVVSATKIWTTFGGQRFALTLSWPLAFSAEQWREIR